MTKSSRPGWRWRLLLLLVSILGIGLLGAGGFIGWNYASLPSVSQLRQVEFIEPLKIYTSDGKLIAEIGEIKRTPIHIDKVPKTILHAFLAAEDARFYQHGGIDMRSLARAVSQYVLSSSLQTGASTITMQLARGFYLSNERTLWRKFREILLAIKIERELPKEKIFELYLNKIFLGHKSYGVVAAAKTYYNAELSDLTTAQMAAIAALPKAPSTLNPISNPRRSLERRNWILLRMRELGYIDDIEFQASIHEPIDATPYKEADTADAPYVAESVRLTLLQPGTLSEEGVTSDYLYTSGINVHTTIDSRLQQASNANTFAGLIKYEERHGYKGPIEHLTLFDTADTLLDPSADPLTHPGVQATLHHLDELPNYSGRFTPALVVRVSKEQLTCIDAKGRLRTLSFNRQFPFFGKYLSADKVERVRDFSGLIAPGDLVYLRRNDVGQWLLAQALSAQTALVSIDPSDGSVLAMVGGADFNASQFNRAVQAKRQFGSNIKPLIYGYGFTRGLSPGSVFVDGPITINNTDNWRPQNASLNFLGPITLHKALYLSRNLVSIRVLNSLGINRVASFIEELGINAPPHDLSLALGTASFTPMDAARSMSMFANSGYLVTPWIIKKVVDQDNTQLYLHQPVGVCMDEVVNQYQSIAEWIHEQIEQNAAQQLADLSSDTPNDSFAGYTKADAQQSTGVNDSSEDAQFQLSVEQIPDPELFDQSWRSRYCGADQQHPKRMLDAASTYMVHSMMLDTITSGTATRALKLERSDLAGKTGTTNDYIDAWFTGVHPMLVTTVWVGLDAPASLGRGESGSRAALPTWINYMQQVLPLLPEATLVRPSQVVSAYIDPASGERVNSNFPGAVLELFGENSLPDYSPKIFLQSPATGARVLNRPEDIFNN